MDKDPVQIGRNHWRTRGTFRVQANDRGRRGAFQRTGEVRGGDLVSRPREGHGEVLNVSLEAELGAGHQTLEGLRVQGGAEWCMPRAKYRHNIFRYAGGTKLEAVQQGGKSHLLPSRH